MEHLDLSKAEGLKVLFLHLSNGPKSWHRMIKYADIMSEMGWDMYPFYPQYDAEKHDQVLRDYELQTDEHLPSLSKLFSNADMVVCSAVHSLKFGCALKAFREVYEVPLIFEADDHPFEVDDNHPSHAALGIGSDIEHNVYDQIYDSDACIVSTPYLKRVLDVHCKDVHVIPNALDLGIWKPRGKPDNGDKIILGWAGASGHAKDLSLIREVFLELLGRHPNLEIKCLHGAVDLIQHERFSNDSTWTKIMDYPHKLASMPWDICVAPLWDSEFNRAKSNLRWLEYSALRIPTVASRVEPYSRSIKDGVDGFLASTKTEWVDKISNLCQDPQLRTSIGNSARKKIEKDYDARRVAQDYADLLKHLHEKIRRNRDVHVPIPSK